MSLQVQELSLQNQHEKASCVTNLAFANLWQQRCCEHHKSSVGLADSLPSVILEDRLTAVCNNSVCDLNFSNNALIADVKLLNFILIYIMISQSTKTLTVFVFIVIASICLTNSIRRDIIYKKDYNSDLRNRVVGARLIADGKSPYYYKWKQADGLRYYDPSNFGNGCTSSITASPFFHRLMIPLSSLPQNRIADIWLVIQYLLLVITTLIAVNLASRNFSKVLIVATGIAFLFTDAWKSHMSTGQLYIFIPFLLAIFTWLFVKVKSKWIFFVGATVATIIVLIRPNFLIFFLPCLLFVKHFTLRKISLLLLPAIIMLAFVIFNPFEQKLWKDYFSSIQQHTAVHQGEHYEVCEGEKDPKFPEWEGLNMSKANFLKGDMTIIPKTENGNVFVIYNLITHKKIGTTALFVISLSLIIFLGGISFKLSKGLDITKNTFSALVIFGFCLYMITDFFSPIHRHQYYTMQWLFVIMLFFSIAEFKKYSWFYFAIAIGIILNILRVPVIKMEHSIGEYLIFAALLFFSLFFIKQSAIEN